MRTVATLIFLAGLIALAWFYGRKSGWFFHEPLFSGEALKNDAHVEPNIDASTSSSTEGLDRSGRDLSLVATDAGASADERHDAGHYYRYEQDGVPTIVGTLKDVPEQFRATALAIPVEEDSRMEIVEEAGGDEQPRQSPLDAQTRTAIEKLNTYRVALGLLPVRVDAARSKASGLHASYLVRNRGQLATQGLGVHTEDEKLPGFSVEGKAAAERSVIAESSFEHLDLAIDYWIDSFFHRMPLIDPTLKSVGFGYATIGNPRGVPPTHIIVLDAGDVSKVAFPPVFFPRDGQQGVRVDFIGNEEPNPIAHDVDGRAGYPITVTFSSNQKVTKVSASLFDDRGREIPGYLSTPETPVREGYQRNTIGLIPHDPLDPATHYVMKVSATVDRALWSKSWSFKTR